MATRVQRKTDAGPVAPEPASSSLPVRTSETGLPADKGAAHLEIRVWLRLLGSANRIETVLQSRFTKEFGISLARFDLMAQLERARDGLTMTDASRRMMVTNGAITSLVDRLVDEGFVTREPHADDRRTTIIRLTAAGRDRFLTMAARHEEWVVGLIGGLAPAALADLNRGLTALRHHLDDLEI